MEKLLQSWELTGTEFLDVLTVNQIDEKNIAELTPTLIKELFPLVGTRMKFMAKWTAAYGQTMDIAHKDTSDTESVESDVQESSCLKKIHQKYKLKRQNAFTNKTSFALRVKTLCIADILKKSIKGQGVLQSYKRTNQMSRKSRNIIVDIIVSEILAKTDCLKQEDFAFLAEQIVKLFPTELSAIYYVPPVKKKNSRNGKSITSRGKLVDKYRNIIRQYKELADDNREETTNEVPGDVVLEEGVAEHVAWLKKNCAPWEEVVSKWQASHAFRRREIEDNRNLQIYEIFDSWPVLKHPQGYMLIEADFSLLNLTTITNDFATWSNFFASVQSTCNVKKDSHSDTLNEFLQQDGLSEDCRVTLQVLLLSHMIPPKGRVYLKKKSTNNTHWKPSITECKASILVHATVPGDVNRLQEERIATMKSFGLTVQPFIIVVGTSLHELSTFYVSVDKVLYKLPSALDALNVCFKAFHTLDASYPPESEHLWLIIQRGLYMFETRWDKTIPYIINIIAAVLNLRRDNAET